MARKEDPCASRNKAWPQTEPEAPLPLAQELQAEQVPPLGPGPLSSKPLGQESLALLCGHPGRCILAVPALGCGAAARWWWPQEETSPPPRPRSIGQRQHKGTQDTVTGHSSGPKMWGRSGHNSSPTSLLESLDGHPLLSSPCPMGNSPPLALTNCKQKCPPNAPGLWRGREEGMKGDEAGKWGEKGR